MIVDTSALIAIAFKEPSAPRMWGALHRGEDVRISAANLLEVWMVLDRRGTEHARELLATLLEGLEPKVEPVTETQVSIAREAWRQYGRGSGHPAKLNFGDCFAYALARSLDEPLLFVGNDFSATDITIAFPDHTL